MTSLAGSWGLQAGDQQYWKTRSKQDTLSEYLTIITLYNWQNIEIVTSRKLITSRTCLSSSEVNRKLAREFISIWHGWPDSDHKQDTTFVFGKAESTFSVFPYSLRLLSTLNFLSVDFSHLQWIFLILRFGESEDFALVSGDTPFPV